jgi:CDP-diacylglycerol--glycerol-3-phosphate 3-phosphatidyltransferase
VFLAGPGFLEFGTVYEEKYLFLNTNDGAVVMTSGVRPWMVAVILARELLVTSIRGVLEGQGIDFSAGWSGKGKMILQSFAVPVALFVAVNPFALDSIVWVAIRDILIWSTIVVTLWSAIPYLRRSRDLLIPPEVESDE